VCLTAFSSGLKLVLIYLQVQGLSPPFRTKQRPFLAVCPVELRFTIKLVIEFIESIFKK